jgi:hypothetical protein
MTTLLEQAVAQLRDLPEDFQDKAARQLIQYVDHVLTDERDDLKEGRQAYRRGDFKPLEQWCNDMGIGDH